MGYRKFEQMALYQAIEDLMAWMVPHVGRWPKWLRPTLGQHAMESMLGILRNATTAYGVPQAQRLQYLQRASADVDSLRMIIRVSVTLRLTSPKQFAHVSGLISEVGRQLGGWIRSVRQGEGG